MVARVAPTTTSVLIFGETGVGKELIAQEIHRLSSRADGPFIVVHIASLAPGLVSSGLFGHERGAFTGATEQTRGRFELANGGTLFLDEIGELGPEEQVRILRVLQEDLRARQRNPAARSVSVSSPRLTAARRGRARRSARTSFQLMTFRSSPAAAPLGEIPTWRSISWSG
jgi:transcriptional regulator with GAF, ATPase, and Fis domain